MTNLFLIFFVFALILTLGIVCVFITIRDIRIGVKKQEKRKKSEMKALREKYLRAAWFINEIAKAKTLNEVFILHIQVWANDIRNDNIGPCAYGIFRTQDILTMKKSDVYLYITEYSHTFTLTKLEKEEDKEIYNAGLKTYKNHLISNINALTKEYEKLLELN